VISCDPTDRSERKSKKPWIKTRKLADGRVTLQGQVESENQKAFAEELAGSAREVRSISNELVIREEAERIAAAAPGILEVENRIEVVTWRSLVPETLKRRSAV